MPLDRRITIEMVNDGTRDPQGRFVAGSLAYRYETWAQRESLGSQFTLDQSGTYTVLTAIFTIRWIEPASRWHLGGIQVIDSLGRYWMPESIVDSGARRRLLAMTCNSVDVGRDFSGVDPIGEPG